MSSNAAIKNDLSIYEKHAAEWWESGSYYFRSLQGITKFRLALIAEWFGEVQGKTIVDLGCGGGLLAVPLSHQGARVIGVEISRGSLDEARKRAAPDSQFIEGDMRAVPLPDQCADFVLLADVLDHVRDYDRAVSEAARLLRPGGMVYVSTISRTFWSWLLAIVIGEGIGLVPKGTHDHSLFIKPCELEQAANNAGLTLLALQGERPAIVKTCRNWAIHFAPTSVTSVAYSALFRKDR